MAATVMHEQGGAMVHCCGALGNIGFVSDFLERNCAGQNAKQYWNDTNAWKPGMLHHLSGRDKGAAAARLRQRRQPHVARRCACEICALEGRVIGPGSSGDDGVVRFRGAQLQAELANAAVGAAILARQICQRRHRLETLCNQTQNRI